MFFCFRLSKNLGTFSYAGYTILSVDFSIVGWGRLYLLQILASNDAVPVLLLPPSPFSLAAYISTTLVSTSIDLGSDIIWSMRLSRLLSRHWIPSCILELSDSRFCLFLCFLSRSESFLFMKVFRSLSALVDS